VLILNTGKLRLSDLLVTATDCPVSQIGVTYTTQRCPPYLQYVAILPRKTRKSNSHVKREYV